VVHAVTNDEVLQSPGFLARAHAVMEALGTRGAVHLRSTRLSGAALFRLAESLARAQAATESWLVINERLDVALAVGARAVQLTARSMAVNDAVTISRQSLVAASVHSIAEARAAAAAGAAWVVAGHIYRTDSHKGVDPRGEGFISEIAWNVGVPVIAIGGVLPGNVAALRRSGARGIAAIRGIWGASDAAIAAADYLSQYDSDGDP
jgi:thiamine-phosphate diphosphorylase